MKKLKKCYLKELVEKKKTEIKNVFTTGFDAGFTKALFRKNIGGSKSKFNKVQVITTKIVEKFKKKPKVKKKQTTKNQKKRKKKKQYGINVL